MEGFFESNIKWALFDNAPIPICIVGLDGSFIDVNYEWSKMTGYGREELKTMNFSQITVPEDLVGDITEMTKIIENGKQSAARLTKRYVHKNGNKILFDLHYNTVMKDGLIVGFVSWALPTDSTSITMLKYRQFWIFMGLLGLGLLNILQFILLL